MTSKSLVVRGSYESACIFQNTEGFKTAPLFPVFETPENTVLPSNLSGNGNQISHLVLWKTSSSSLS